MTAALNRTAIAAILLGGAATLANLSIYNVDGGERAVIFDRLNGVLPNTVGEGTHLLFPWLQKAIMFDIRTRPRSIQSVTGSKDLQSVNITVRVLSKPQIEALPVIYSRLGVDYDERVLPSIANEVLKSTVAQFDAGELITKREIVSSQIREGLVRRAADFNLQLDDVAITQLSFSKEFIHAVERKQIAQQQAEKSRYEVQRAEFERQAAVVRAEGESESARLISSAIVKAGDGFIELRRIEAAREIAGTLSAARNITYLPNTSNMLMQMRTGSMA